MVSPLPPRLRDTVDIQDRVRQDRANLDQLFVGFHGGRFPPSKRLGIGASAGVFDEGDDDDEEGDEQTTAWEYNDRHVVAVAGGQVALLSHEPLDESLQVYWHPRGLTYAPLRWPAEQFTVDSNRVTLPDSGSLIEAADAFSFQYEYLTGDDSEVLLQELFVNSRSSAVLTGPVLDADSSYRVEVLGTYTVVDPGTTGSHIALIYPSSGGVGFANSDVEWRFGYDGADTGPFPHSIPLSLFRYRHGSGGSWINWTPTTTTPNAQRTYDREIVGQGSAIEFQFFDSAYSDNDGQIRVRVYQE